MSLPVEVLTHAIRWSKTPEAAAQLILVYEDMQRRVAERKRDAASILKIANARVAEMMLEVLCDHTVTKRHADPSGGSDSHETCLICGEIITHKEARFT